MESAICRIKWWPWLFWSRHSQGKQEKGSREISESWGMVPQYTKFAARMAIGRWKWVGQKKGQGWGNYHKTLRRMNRGAVPSSTHCLPIPSSHVHKQSLIMFQTQATSSLEFKSLLNLGYPNWILPQLARVQLPSPSVFWYGLSVSCSAQKNTIRNRTGIIAAHINTRTYLEPHLST